MATGQDKYVQFTDIQKSYDGETLVVKDLNLSIRRGEFLTMLGPSGSGKTTTLLMLAGFEVPTHGRIELDGQEINDLASGVDKDALRGPVSYTHLTLPTICSV